MLKGEAKKLYQREYMRRYMRRLRGGLEPAGIESGDDYIDKVCQVCGHYGVYDNHHIDRDYTNNTPGNKAILCPTCHAEVHRRGRVVSGLSKTQVDADGNIIYEEV